MESGINQKKLDTHYWGKMKTPFHHRPACPMLALWSMFFI
jgi:hypothetical protein